MIKNIINNAQDALLIGTIKSGLKREFKKEPETLFILFPENKEVVKYRIVFSDETTKEGVKDLENSNYLEKIKSVLSDKENKRFYIIDFKTKKIK